MGCTQGMLNPNLESYRQRALKEGHEVTADEMAEVKGLLTPMFNETCTCLMNKMAQKWSFEEFRKFPRDFREHPEAKEFVESLIKNKECPVPIPSP
jgi:hypothetical protein